MMKKQIGKKSGNKTLMNYTKAFKIDKTNSDEEYLCVDVEGLGTVMIESPYKTKLNGMVAEVFRFHVVDEPVASTWAHINDLSNPQSEVDYEAHNSSSSGDDTGTRELAGGIG